MNSYGWAPIGRRESSVWVPHSPGDPLPSGAVHVGMDKSGDRLYAGRALHEGDLLPAKINPNHTSAYVCWGGSEHAVDHYEVLCGINVAWQSVHGGCIPPSAVVMGYTADGEKLFMGRAFHDGTLTPGKLQPSHKSLYIPYNGEEVPVDEFEVMIYRPPMTI